MAKVKLPLIPGVKLKQIKWIPCRLKEGKTLYLIFKVTYFAYYFELYAGGVMMVFKHNMNTNQWYHHFIGQQTDLNLPEV